MLNFWQDFGMWFMGLLVMVLGAGFPTYLFHSEGITSLFGNVIYVIAGAVLFSAGLGISFFRIWLKEQHAGTVRP